jgi:XapX domain-containing protein
MKVYVISLSIGLCVGGIYGLLGVRSPAPPVVALVGLLGMLIGEQVIPWIKHRTFDHQAITHVSDYSPRRLGAADPPRRGDR